MNKIVYSHNSMQEQVNNPELANFLVLTIIWFCREASNNEVNHVASQTRYLWFIKIRLSTDH